MWFTYLQLNVAGRAARLRPRDRRPRQRGAEAHRRRRDRCRDARPIVAPEPFVWWPIALAVGVGLAAFAARGPRPPAWQRSHGNAGMSSAHSRVRSRSRRRSRPHSQASRGRHATPRRGVEHARARTRHRECRRALQQVLDRHAARARGHDGALPRSTTTIRSTTSSSSAMRRCTHGTRRAANPRTRRCRVRCPSTRDAVGETFYRFDHAGRFLFVCHLPGHFAFGMRGWVIVDPM